MSDFKARDAFNGTANQTVKCSSVMNSLVITNDGDANITFTAVGNTYTLRPGYTFDEELEPFNTIVIAATDSYFGYVRRSKSETR